VYKKVKTPFLLIAIAIILTPYFVAKAIKGIKNIQVKKTQSFDSSERKHQPI